LADNTSSIRSDGGGDYTTIQGWENALNGNLVGTTTRQIGELTVNEAFDETVTIDGGTSNASYYMWLRSASGNEYNHTDGSGGRISYTSSTYYAFAAKDDYVRLGGSEGSSSGAVYVGYSGTSTTQYGIELRNCSSVKLQQVFVSVDGSSQNSYGVYTSGSGGSHEAWNCGAVGIYTTGSAKDAIGFAAYSGVSLTCTNCFAIDIDCGASGDDEYGFGPFSVTCYNCYTASMGGDNIGDRLGYHSGVGGDYNAADDTSSSIFTNNLQSKAAGDQFVGGSPYDYHLKSGADLIDAGNDAHSNEYDIDGAVSGDRDDIGLHEYVAAGGGVTIPVMDHNYRLRRTA
jgi:hypothetical protein